MRERALDVTDLGVRLGDRPLLAGVCLHVEAGERVAVLGPSGAGKSLTAAAVAGVLPPALRRTGSVRAAGPVALVRQDSQTALHPLVPVGRQLALPWRARGHDRAAARDAAVRTAADLDLEDALLERLPGELSGGQRQRACLALALGCAPAVLVADEPTSALDPITRGQVAAALGTVPAAVLLVTHDHALAERLCTRAVVVEGGRVVPC